MPRSSSALDRAPLPSKSKWWNHAVGLSSRRGGAPLASETLISSRWSQTHASMPPGRRKSSSWSASPWARASCSHAGHSSPSSLAAKVFGFTGSSAVRAPSAIFLFSRRSSARRSATSSPPPPCSRSSGTQASRKKLRGSTVGSLSRTALLKGARHSGQTGPGGSGKRRSLRCRQRWCRATASSCTCSAQSRQMKCGQTRKPCAPTNTPGLTCSESKHTPHSAGSSAGPHSSDSSGGPVESLQRLARTRHCASRASRTISTRPFSRQVRRLFSMSSKPSLCDSSTRARPAWPARSA
mmetsp:Transcript_96166/g.261184  ORF Transcript_96166/g.261184 Transcript_96166/m.261184 type:complete len:296 (+) Transcript_96166:1051-1938(+)